MRYVTTVEIRVDVPDAIVMENVHAAPGGHSDTREKRQALVSADIKELIEEEMGDESFTFFDVQVTTVESDG